jgi:Na+/H+ antiporter NhaC
MSNIWMYIVSIIIFCWSVFFWIAGKRTMYNIFRTTRIVTHKSLSQKENDIKRDFEIIWWTTVIMITILFAAIFLKNILK